ncbi:hypothetical protein [Luteococcus sp.]|uniref:hypothetical protein n=1 Tax=Luteococcus sp. TaxID=1969402 RepID=UPI00373671FA
MGDPGFGPQGRVSKPAREHVTADKPPTKNLNAQHQPSGRNNDPHAWAARRLVNQQRLLADAPVLLRLQLINLLAKRSRRAADQGQVFDWETAARFVHERFADAVADDELIGHEAMLLRQALANMRADQLAAPKHLEETPAVGAMDRNQTVPRPPSGPTLEQLAEQEIPAVVDDNTLVTARAIELARMTLEALAHDPATDVRSHLAQLTHPLRGAPGHELVTLFSTRSVIRAYEESLAEAEHRSWKEDHQAADPAIQAMILASLEEARRAA